MAGSEQCVDAHKARHEANRQGRVGGLCVWLEGRHDCSDVAIDGCCEEKEVLMSCLAARWSLISVRNGTNPKPLSRVSFMIEDNRV
jgi:hypothetical protein